jgi:hypothetical protein
VPSSISDAARRGVFAASHPVAEPDRVEHAKETVACSAVRFAPLVPSSSSGEPSRAVAITCTARSATRSSLLLYCDHKLVIFEGGSASRAFEGRVARVGTIAKRVHPCRRPRRRSPVRTRTFRHGRVRWRRSCRASPAPHRRVRVAAGQLAHGGGGLVLARLQSVGQSLPTSFAVKLLDFVVRSFLRGVQEIC